MPAKLINALDVPKSKHGDIGNAHIDRMHTAGIANIPIPEV